jgi:hypothetical protein
LLTDCLKTSGEAFAPPSALDTSNENSFGPRLISKRCLLTFLARIGEFLHNLGRKSHAGYAFLLWMGQKYSIGQLDLPCVSLKE